MIRELCIEEGLWRALLRRELVKWTSVRKYLVDRNLKSVNRMPSKGGLTMPVVWFLRWPLISPSLPLLVGKADFIGNESPNI